MLFLFIGCQFGEVRQVDVVVQCDVEVGRIDFCFLYFFSDDGVEVEVVEFGVVEFFGDFYVEQFLFVGFVEYGFVDVFCFVLFFVVWDDFMIDELLGGVVEGFVNVVVENFFYDLLWDLGQFDLI